MIKAIIIKIKMFKATNLETKKFKNKIITIFKASKAFLTTTNCWNQSMWIKWITSTFKISKKPTWLWNAKSKKWLNLKKMDLISLWSKKVLKTKKVFKLIKSKKVSKTVRKAGWWMKTLTSSSLKSWEPLKRFQMQNSWKKTKEKEILVIKNNQKLEKDTKKVLKRCLFTRESILIKMKLLNKKQELKLKAAEKCGNLVRMKSTIMMRHTMKTTMISIMMMAIIMTMDIMITITQIATTIPLTTITKRFIILTEIISLRDTREELVEATRRILMFQDIQIIMEAIRSLQGLSTIFNKVQSIMIEIIIKKFLIIKVHSEKKKKLKMLKKEKFLMIISKKITKNL
jgi:hypothetical protein